MESVTDEPPLLPLSRRHPEIPNAATLSLCVTSSDSVSLCCERPCASCRCRGACAAISASGLSTWRSCWSFPTRWCCATCSSPNGSGTSQVDLVVATRGALYIAEVKTWDAAIEAVGDGGPWTVRYSHRDSRSVRCPVRQADSHRRTVMAVLRHADVSCRVLRSVVLEGHRGLSAPASVHVFPDASKFAAWVSRHSATARIGDVESALAALKAANIRGRRARREHITRARALRQDHHVPFRSQLRPRRVAVTAFVAGVLFAIVYSAVPEANRPRLVAETPPVTLDGSGVLSVTFSTLCDEVHYALIGHPDTATWAFRATGRQGALESVFKQGAIARALIAVDRFLTGGEISVYRPTARFMEAAAVGDLLAGSRPRAAYLACQPISESPLDHVLEGMLLPRASLEREVPVWTGVHVGFPHAPVTDRDDVFLIRFGSSEK